VDDHLPPRLRKARERDRKLHPNDAVGRVWDEIAALLGDGYHADSKVTITHGQKSVEVYAYSLLGLDALLAEYEDEEFHNWRERGKPIPPTPKFHDGFEGDLMRAIAGVLTDRMPWLNHQMTRWPCRQDRDDFIGFAAGAVVRVLIGLKNKAVAKMNEVVPEEKIREEAYLAWEKAKEANPGLPPGDGKDFWLAAEARLKIQRLKEALQECLPVHDTKE